MPPANGDGAGVPNKADEMETDDGVESEDEDARETEVGKEAEGEIGETADDRMKEKIRQSLVRLARVLNRFAKKGEGTDVDVDVQF